MLDSIEEVTKEDKFRKIFLEDIIENSRKMKKF